MAVMNIGNAKRQKMNQNPPGVYRREDFQIRESVRQFCAIN